MDKLVILTDLSKFKLISNMHHGVRCLRFVVLPNPCYIKRSQKNNDIHAMQVLYQLSYGPICKFYYLYKINYNPNVNSEADWFCLISFNKIPSSAKRELVMRMLYIQKERFLAFKTKCINLRFYYWHLPTVQHWGCRFQPSTDKPWEVY